MYSLKTTETICISHCLSGMPEGQKCSRLHGHNEKITVKITGVESLDSKGMVIDFGEIKEVIKKFDHIDLNSLMGKDNPTAENLAQYLWAGIARKIFFAGSKGNDIYLSVEVEETEGNKVTFCKRVK